DRRRPYPALGARRREQRPALSCASFRGTQRPARPLVLARRIAGGRRTERHDVSLGASGAPPADATGGAARFVASGPHHGAYRQPEVVAAPIRCATRGHLWPRG